MVNPTRENTHTNTHERALHTRIHCANILLELNTVNVRNEKNNMTSNNFASEQVILTHPLSHEKKNWKWQRLCNCVCEPPKLTISLALSTCKKRQTQIEQYI